MRTVGLAAGESVAALFPVVDPIGNAPAFAALTARLEAQGGEAGDGKQESVAFAPMAIPLLAGPGAMGIVMGLEARESDFLVIPGFALGIIAISAVTFACLRASGLLTRFLGRAGVDAVTRIMGLLVWQSASS